MAPKPEPARLAYVFGMVLAVAAIILAITTHNLAAPARHRYTILNFCFCTKAVDQLLDPGRPPAYSRHQRRLCSLALPKTGRTAGISELRDYWRPVGVLPLTP